MGFLFAEDMTPRIRAAVLAGLPDYHGNPFPAVVEPPPAPRFEPDPDVVTLEPVTIDTTRLPLQSFLVTPDHRNVIERLLPGTGVTVTETKYGKRTVGRLLCIPVLFNLNW